MGKKKTVRIARPVTGQAHRLSLGYYFGGKAGLAPWIIGHLPPHTCYVEPFGGSAAVLLQRTPPAPREVYNDLDYQVATLFRVLRERPQELIRQVYFTPFSLDAVAEAAQRVPHDWPDRELEVARRFLVRTKQTRAGATRRDPPKWLAQKDTCRGGYYAQEWADYPGPLLAIAARFKHVQIEQRDAAEVIEEYDTPDTCFYVDPPYPGQRAGTYRCELAEDGHAQLAAMLHQIQGMAIVSGCPGPYAALYQDWLRVDTQAPTQGKPATEYLWLSPAVQKRGVQPRLFPTAELADAL